MSGPIILPAHTPPPGRAHALPRAALLEGLRRDRKNDDKPDDHGLKKRRDAQQIEPLRKTPMINTPMMVPITPPVPPERLVPPMTTAAMASSS